MHEKKSWDINQTDPKNYFYSFVDGHEEFGYEMLYFEGDKLICIDLLDILEDGISSIYCYYDPEYLHLSIGKYTLLRQILFAKQNNLDWIYLGYYVKDCPSLAYKEQYKPYKTLVARPIDSEEDSWI